MSDTVSGISEHERGGATGTLYERLGGAYAIATAVDCLIENLHKNETLNAANPHVKDFHVERYKAGYKFMVTAWVIEMTGGPKCYPGREMLDSHRHLGLSQYEFQVTAHEIRNTLYQCGVPRLEIDQLMAIIDRQRDAIVSRSD